VMNVATQQAPERAEEIKQIFDALNKAGLDSMEKVTSATTDQLIPALAQLQTQKFPFKEAADDVNTLIERVNALPDEIHKRIIVDVETNDPSGILPSIQQAPSIGATEGKSY
jgi:hypothetical protein